LTHKTASKFFLLPFVSRSSLQHLFNQKERDIILGSDQEEEEEESKDEQDENSPLFPDLMVHISPILIQTLASNIQFLLTNIYSMRVVEQVIKSSSSTDSDNNSSCSLLVGGLVDVVVDKFDDGTDICDDKLGHLMIRRLISSSSSFASQLVSSLTTSCSNERKVELISSNRRCFVMVSLAQTNLKQIKELFKSVNLRENDHNKKGIEVLRDTLK